MIKQFHHNKFLPTNSLLSTKTQAGLKISLIIPALNEAGTIGTIIEIIKRDLIDEIQLVDELIVMECNSSDNTYDIAKNAGATVFKIGEIAPQFSQIGKGIALWKSLQIAQGDLIVCIDADIVNFDSRFIYGLIGPLLVDKSISFVKAYYKRPFAINNHLYDNYGGRVTEILVRPFLSTFFPDLAKLYQPLAGEYAFRHSLIREIPFLSGYSVEIGLILYLYKYYGLKIFAQTDMEIRCHRNRTVNELGKMSFGILQTLLRYLKEEQLVSFKTEVYNKLLIFNNNEWNESSLEEIVLPVLSTYLESYKNREIVI